MTKQLSTDGWSVMPDQRAALHDGLSLLERAGDMLQAIRAHNASFERRVQTEEAWAEEIRQSFAYFLSSASIHRAYVFAAWIDQPAALVAEIGRFAQLFDLVQ